MCKCQEDRDYSREIHKEYFTLYSTKKFNHDFDIKDWQDELLEIGTLTQGYRNYIERRQFTEEYTSLQVDYKCLMNDITELIK